MSIIPIDPASLLKVTEKVMSDHVSGELSDGIFDAAKKEIPQLFIPESSAQGSKFNNSSALTFEKGNREEVGGEEDKKELKLFVEKAFMMIEQREFARDAMDQMLVRVSNASGPMRDEMQKILDKMRFRDEELRQQEENKNKTKKEEEYNPNIDISNSIDDVKRFAAVYMQRLQFGIKLVGALVQNYFDADGNEILEPSAESKIMKVDHKDMDDVNRGMSSIFKVLEDIGFKVETQEYLTTDSKGQHKSATSFAVHLFEGLSIDNITSMTQENIERALKMRNEGAKVSSENVVTGIFGSMEVMDMANAFKNFSEQFNQVNKIEQESTKFRDMFPSRLNSQNNDYASTFAQRFSGSRGESGGRY